MRACFRFLKMFFRKNYRYMKKKLTPGRYRLPHITHFVKNGRTGLYYNSSRKITIIEIFSHNFGKKKDCRRNEIVKNIVQNCKLWLKIRIMVENRNYDRKPKFWNKKNYRARPGFEPGTTRTLSEYHTPRPTSQLFIDPKKYIIKDTQIYFW